MSPRTAKSRGYLPPPPSSIARAHTFSPPCTPPDPTKHHGGWSTVRAGPRPDLPARTNTTPSLSNSDPNESRSRISPHKRRIPRPGSSPTRSHSSPHSPPTVAAIPGTSKPAPTTVIRHHSPVSGDSSRPSNVQSGKQNGSTTTGSPTGKNSIWDSLWMFDLRVEKSPARSHSRRRFDPHPDSDPDPTHEGWG